MRIISLLASSTETICALGHEGLLVGRSHECDYPSSIRHLPACSRPRLSMEKKSLDIDRDLKGVLSQGLSIYEVDVETVSSLNPDLIVTQDHCAVCAVSYDDIVSAACHLIPSQPKIVTLHPNALSDVYADILRISEAIDGGISGMKLTEEMKNSMKELSFKLQGSPKPRVAFIEWIEPLMSCGNWMPELISIAGGESVFGEIGGHTPYLAVQQLAEADPDFIVIAPCGFDLQRTAVEMDALIQDPEFCALRAVHQQKVALCDGNALFNRPGPRLVESVKVLSDIFHGHSFADTGDYWQWWRM